MFKRLILILCPLFLFWSLYLVVAYSNNQTIDLQTTFTRIANSTNDVYQAFKNYLNSIKLMGFGLFSGVDVIGLKYTGVHSLSDFFNNIQVFFSQIGFIFKFFFDFCGNFVFGGVKCVRALLEFALNLCEFLIMPSLKPCSSWY